MLFVISDISNAFLHGSLEERIVMSQTAGFIDNKLPNYVFSLQKAIYELKQLP